MIDDMKLNKAARSAFAVLLCAACIAYAAVCLYTGGFAMYANLSDARPFASLRDARAFAATLEDALYQNMYGRTLLFEAHAAAQRFAGKYETNGFEILRDKAGFLEYGRFAPYGLAQARANAQKLWRLQSLTEARGGKFLFVAPPARCRRYEAGAYPVGLPYPNPHPFYDALFYQLHLYGVAAADLRVNVEEEGLPFDAYTFRTDDRLPAEAAFSAFRAAVDALNRDFDAGLDPDGFYRDIRAYQKETYAQSFLGYIGRRAGMAFGGLDDFTVMWPAFPSFYTLTTYSNRGVSQTWAGPGPTTLLQPEVLREAAEARDPHRFDLYRVYLGGAYYYARIRNPAAVPDAPRLLLIHDGTAAPLAVFLAPLFREITIVAPVKAKLSADAESYLRDRMESMPEYVIVESRAENLEGL
ncbi:MAG: hypothetical protein LBS24_08470 [Clostridiales Family XIII bacterium]|jgi:hypothetical protein|nr:hypothetical protein [Clostridiales Family XIII bacterium]